jgi:hypothetical protein
MSCIMVSPNGWEAVITSDVWRTIMITESRDVKDFKHVELLIAEDLVIEQGEVEALRIEGNEEIVPLIETVVENETLKIRYAKDVDIPNIIRNETTIFLTAKALNAITLMGSGDIKTSDIKTENLAVVLAGSGDITMDRLTADNLAVDIKGSGDFETAGKASAQSYSIKGSGDIDTAKLEGEICNIDIKGSGDVAVNVTKLLNVVIKGRGDVRYFGDPQVSQVIKGSGSVRRTSH